MLNSYASEGNAYTKSNEKLVFGFNSTKGKILSISMDQNEEYIVYHYGTKDKIELEFPANKEDSYKLFTYSSYMRPGGVANSGMDMSWEQVFADAETAQAVKQIVGPANEQNLDRMTQVLTNQRVS